MHSSCGRCIGQRVGPIRTLWNVDLLAAGLLERITSDTGPESIRVKSSVVDVQKGVSQQRRRHIFNELEYWWELDPRIFQSHIPEMKIEG